MQRLRIGICLLFLAIMVAGLAACGGSHKIDAPALLTSITVADTPSTPLQRGQSVQLRAVGHWTNGVSGPVNKVTWHSADPSIATVSSTGLVTAVAHGTTEITASLNQIQGRGSVSVRGLAGGTIGAAGGDIVASDGTKLQVAPNSTAGGADVHIEIDTQDNLPGALPEGATQASKIYVLTKDATYNFTQPISVTIPVDHASLANGEFPAIFYFAENKYRAVPIVAVDRTNDLVTFRTDHFNAFVAFHIPALATLAQTLTMETNFRPSVDGFFHPNFGSYNTAGGACMGMAMYSEWFYEVMKSVDGNGLFTKYREGDPAKWQDDVTAHKLIEQTFDSTKNIWGLYANAATGDEGLSPAETALVMWLALSITNDPQTLMIRFTNGQAHMVTVYNWDATTHTFGIYDSNFPGEDGIRLGWDATNGFVNFNKAGAYPPIQGYTFLPIGVALEGPEFKRTYHNAEAGWAPTVYDDIVFTAPVPDANGDILIDGNQALTVTGTVTPAGHPTHVVYSWNGTPMGVAPLTNNTFTFTIPAAQVVGYSNTVSVVTTSDRNDVWDIEGREEMVTHIKGSIFFQNPGFELGDFTGWIGETHTWYDTTPGSFTPGKSEIIDSATTAFDPIDIALPTTRAGRYSARVNNEDNDYHISSISQTVTVPQGGSAQIQFYWAAVLEDPQHDPQDQPYVDIKVTDDDAGTVLFSAHYFSNDPNYIGWIPVQGGSWKVIDWQPVTIPVAAAQGHKITIHVVGADCALGGHGGYVYFDADQQ